MGWKEFWDKKSSVKTELTNRFKSYDPVQLKAEADSHVRNSWFFSTHEGFMGISTELNFTPEQIEIETIMSKRGKIVVFCWTLFVTLVFLSQPFSMELAKNGWAFERLHVYLIYASVAVSICFLALLSWSMEIGRANTKIRKFLINKMKKQKPIAPVHDDTA